MQLRVTQETAVRLPPEYSGRCATQTVEAAGSKSPAEPFCLACLLSLVSSLEEDVSSGLAVQRVVLWNRRGLPLIFGASMRHKKRGLFDVGPWTGDGSPPWMPHLRGLGWVAVILAGGNWRFHDAMGSLPWLCVGPVDRKLETPALSLRKHRTRTGKNSARSQRILQALP